MTLTYCMSSHCPLARGCLRYEDDVARHAIPSRAGPDAQPGRTYADFSEELIRRDAGVECPFFIALAAAPPRAALPT